MSLVKKGSYRKLVNNMRKMDSKPTPSTIDDWEDLLWYSEDDIVTKPEALERLHALKGNGTYRLYTIYRPANKRFLVEEYEKVTPPVQGKK